MSGSRRPRSELAQELHPVPLAPAFRDPSVLDANDLDPGKGDRPPARRDAEVRACVRGASGPPDRDRALVGVDDQILDGRVEVREDREEFAQAPLVVVMGGAAVARAIGR